MIFDPVQPGEYPATAFRIPDLGGTAGRGQEQSPERNLQEITATLDRDDPINIQYTSGTTGFPKAVVLTHHNILNNAWFSAQAMHFTEQDRLCVPVPFYHCFGMVLANLLCLSVGACIVVPCEHFDPQAVLEAVGRERCSAIHGVPTMFIALLEHPRFGSTDFDSMRTGIMAGAPCPPALLQRVMQDMHCPEILIGYGETEASPLTHLTTRDDDLERRIETVGRNLPHQEVKIIATESGRTVALRRSRRDLLSRLPHHAGLLRRCRRPPPKAIDAHGWLHSGDLGSMDADGYVRITGRLKDMIIRGGENIYPREIEDVIYTHPKVAAVAVFGVPDEFYGEQVMAWVQLHAGAQVSEAELRAYCKGSLAHFKIPAYIRFVDEFPMTVTGKLQKFRMREIAIKEMQQENGKPGYVNNLCRCNHHDRNCSRPTIAPKARLARGVLLQVLILEQLMPFWVLTAMTLYRSISGFSTPLRRVRANAAIRSAIWLRSSESRC